MLKILVRTSQNTFLLHYKCRMTNEVTTTKKEKKKVICGSNHKKYPNTLHCVGRMHSPFNVFKMLVFIE